MNDSAEILRQVVQGTNRATGRGYFRSLARSLANAVGVRYCFVTECLELPPNRVRTLAFWSGQDFAANIEYDVVATPCREVLDGTSCAYGQDIQALFPDDEDLVVLEAESYAAAPLVSSAGDVIGHLVVLDNRPFAEPSLDLSLLELFAGRAAAELERQKTTTELSISEARLRQVIDLVPHFIFAKDSDGRFILVNKALADAYGTSVSDLKNKRDADFTASEEEVARFRRDDLEVIKTGETKVIAEESITDASGKVRLLQTTKIPFHFTQSETPSILGVSTDITELRQAEKMLRAIVEGTAATVGEAFFKPLTRHLAEALETRHAVVAEFDGEIVRTRAIWSSGVFLPSLEYPLPGSPCVQVKTTQTTAFFPQGLQQIFPNHSLISDLGAESYLGTPLFDGDQQPIGLLAVLDDRPMEDSALKRYLLSIFASRAAAEMERKRFEDHHQILQSQLLHVQKLESLGVLAGGIAHDFNNLLTGILGNADLATLLLKSGSPDRIDRHLEEIKTAAKRSAELTNQMLAYAGRGSFAVKRLDLNRLVKEMISLLSVSISKKAQIHLDLALQLSDFDGDATQIRQVVMNLVSNASDALGDKPGHIHVRTGVREAHRTDLDDFYLAEQLPEGLYLFLEVEDDGCGMTEETLNLLFDPFFSTKKSGRGLGLAALLGIVRGHYGAAKVKSVLGEGSTFTILLPPSRSTQDKTTEPTRDSIAAWRGSGKILLVDDEQVVRFIVDRMLKRLGFEVLIAEDGRQAIDIYRRHSAEIRAVVLDLMMPELDGLETFHELKLIDPAVKVLLASGFSRQAFPAALEKEGVAGFLQKPLLLEQLQAKLQEILS